MLFSQTFFYLLMGLGTALGLPALWLFARAKWPRMAERARQAATRGIFSSLLMGLPVLIILGVVAQKLNSSGRQPLQVLALLLIGTVLLWSLAGVAGLATHIGERLWPHLAEAEQPWRTTWKGGLVIVGCLLIPFIGWFFLLFLLPVLGAGLQVRAWFTRAPVSPPLPAEPPALAVPPPGKF